MTGAASPELRRRLGAVARSVARVSRPPAPAPRPAEKATIELWYQPNGLDPEAIMGAELARFEAEHPGVEVRGRLIGWEETLTKLATATRSGAVPDVAFVGSAWVADLNVDRAFHAFSPDELARIGASDRFHAAPWATGVAATGEVIGIPWLVDTRLLFYRTDILEQAGVDPTRDLADWASFERSLERLEASGVARPWAVPGRNDWHVVHNALAWIWAAGGSPVGEDGTSTLSSPETLRGLSELQRLVVRYGDDAALALDAETLRWDLVSGKIAMTINGPWLGQLLDDNLPDGAWGAVPLPAGPRGTATLVGGSHLAVNAGTPHPQAAIDLVAFLSQPASQSRMAEHIGMLPARVDATLAGPQAAATRAALATAEPFRRVPGWMEIEHTLQRSFSSMWASAEQGAPLTDEELHTLLEEASEQVALTLERG